MEMNDTTKSMHTLAYIHTINVAISYSTFENGAENIGDRNTSLLTRNKINILFYSVEFYNNSGYDGGNVAISYSTLDNGWNSSVTFKKCTFVKGYAEHYGGGLYMEAILRTNSTSLKYFSSSRTILTLVAVNFTNSTAKTVGAGFYLQVHENPFLSATASIHFSFCIFEGNLAYSECTRRNSCTCSQLPPTRICETPNPTVQYCF